MLRLSSILVTASFTSEDAHIDNTLQRKPKKLGEQQETIESLSNSPGEVNEVIRHLEDEDKRFEANLMLEGKDIFTRFPFSVNLTQLAPDESLFVRRGMTRGETIGRTARRSLNS
jgi:hypothetical protein